MQTFQDSVVGMAFGLIGLRDLCNLWSDRITLSAASDVTGSGRVTSRIAAFIARMFRDPA